MTLGFDDESIKSSNRNDRPDKYKGKKGRTDRIRFMTDPEKFFGANIKGATEGSGFFAISVADPEDCQAALTGDPAAIKRCEKVCPLWKRNYPIVEKYAALVFWIAAEQGGKTKRMNQSMPYVYGGDKGVMLRDIQKSLPVNPKTGKPVPLQSVELIVNCDDDRFQKLRFLPVTSKAQKLTTYDECKEAVGGDFEDPADLTSRCQVIEDSIAPEPASNLIASIGRAEKGEDVADDDDDFKPKAGKGKAKAEAEDGDADESKDFDVDADADADADPEPEEKPKAKTGKAPATKPVAGKSKPKAAEPDDDNIDLEDIDL